MRLEVNNIAQDESVESVDGEDMVDTGFPDGLKYYVQHGLSFLINILEPCHQQVNSSTGWRPPNQSSTKGRFWKITYFPEILRSSPNLCGYSSCEQESLVRLFLNNFFWVLGNHLIGSWNNPSE